MLFPAAEKVDLLAYSPYCIFNVERQAGKLWIPILKSLVRPDSESNALLMDAFTTRPSDLFTILEIVKH